MREIKFRAWDKIESRMMNWVDRIHWGNGSNIESIAQTTPLESHKRKGEDIEIMQFTGLFDKNGKEIYEGDIVKYDYGNPFKREIPNPKIREIVFVDGAFCLKDDDQHYNQKININLSFRIESVEIIGSIYENPELLKR